MVAERDLHMAIRGCGSCTHRKTTKLSEAHAAKLVAARRAYEENQEMIRAHDHREWIAGHVDRAWELNGDRCR